MNNIALIAMVFSWAIMLADDDIEFEFEINCIDNTTGHVMWNTKVKTVSFPELCIDDDGALVVDSSRIVYDEITLNERLIKSHCRLDVENGNIVNNKSLPGNKLLINELKVLTSNLKFKTGDMRGEIIHREGYTMDLKIRYEAMDEMIVKMQDYPKSLNIYKDVAIFTFENYGGLVYAYDFKTMKVKWEYYAARDDSSIECNSTADVYVDSEVGQILCAVDQVIILLNIDNGLVIRKINLPKQNIRSFDRAWTKIGKLKNRYYVSCYDFLYVLDAISGKMLWTFDCGPIGMAWPVIYGNNVYISSRKMNNQDKEDQRKHSFLESQLANGGCGIKRPIVVMGYRSGNDIKLKLISRIDVPAGKRVLTIFNKPEAGVFAKQKVFLKMMEHGDVGGEIICVDMSGVYMLDGEFYYQIGNYTKMVILNVNELDVTECKVP